jgi:hypothetical protein
MRWSAFWDGLKKRDASKVLHTWATWNAEGYFCILAVWTTGLVQCKRSVLGVSYPYMKNSESWDNAGAMNRTVQDRLGQCRIYCILVQDIAEYEEITGRSALQSKKVHIFKGLKQIIMSSLMCFKFFHIQGADSFGPFARGPNKYIEEILIVTLWRYKICHITDWTSCWRTIWAHANPVQCC